MGSGGLPPEKILQKYTFWNTGKTLKSIFTYATLEAEKSMIFNHNHSQYLTNIKANKNTN